MKTTIDIADGLLAEAKAVAKQERCTLRDLTEEGLRLALDRRRQKRVELKPGVGWGDGPTPGFSGGRLTEILYGNEADRALGVPS